VSQASEILDVSGGWVIDARSSLRDDGDDHSGRPRPSSTTASGSGPVLRSPFLGAHATCVRAIHKISPQCADECRRPGPGPGRASDSIEITGDETQTTLEYIETRFDPVHPPYATAYFVLHAQANELRDYVNAIERKPCSGITLALQRIGEPPCTPPLHRRAGSSACLHSPAWIWCDARAAASARSCCNLSPWIRDRRPMTHHSCRSQLLRHVACT
jgi:hypothetical protein